MAENQNVPQEPTQQQEPQGNEPVDYEALYKEAVKQSRKWEDRAKANKDKADKWDEYEQQGLSDAERLTKRAEEAEAKLAALEADAQRRKDAEEVAREKGVPAGLLLYCADREAMERFAEEYEGSEKPPVAPPAPSSRVLRGDGGKATTADQFAEMAEQFFNH